MANLPSQLEAGGDYLPPQVKFHQERRARLQAARAAQEAVVAKFHPPLSARYQGGHRYEVTSEKGVKEYEVVLSRRGASCTCPHYTNRLVHTGGECKHARAAREECFRRTLRAARQRSPEELDAALSRGGWMPEETAAIRQALSEIREPGEDDPAWAGTVRRYEVNGTPVSSYR